VTLHEYYFNEIMFHIVRLNRIWRIEYYKGVIARGLAVVAYTSITVGLTFAALSLALG